MIKLFIVSWVQVFITFMLAYFCVTYSKLISIVFSPFIWFSSRCSLRSRAKHLYGGGVAREVEEQSGKERGNEKREFLGEVYSNNYPTFLFSCLIYSLEHCQKSNFDAEH